MFWYTYLYENILFTNKWDAALIIERKDVWEACEEENRVAIIKSFIMQDRKVTDQNFVNPHLPIRIRNFLNNSLIFGKLKPYNKILSFVAIIKKYVAI